MGVFGGSGRLGWILDELEKSYGRQRPPKLSSPFEMVLWENVAYLVDDERREKAFRDLRERVGTDPESILSAPRNLLLEIAGMGGMLASHRVEKLLQAAEIALRDFRGNLRSCLALPLTQAKKALGKFPSIGDPGAEKILLFCKSRPVLALESNGLRVLLLRLGFGEEKKSYSATYRSIQESAGKECQKDCRWLIRAHLLLRRHGQELCRRSRPLCEACPLARECAYYQIPR